MKTWEMIKELTENPEKKFISKGQIGEGYVSVKNNAVVWLGKGQVGQSLTINHLQSGEWEEVKEPVDFMTAVKSGKRIKFIQASYFSLSDDYQSLTDSLDDLVNEIGYELGSKYVAKALTECKFYIED